MTLKLFIAVILATALTIESISCDNNNFIRIKLHKLDNNHTVIDNQINAINNEPIPVPLNSVLKAVWFGKINVGTPKQEFTVLFDTGADQLWLPSSKCRSISCLKHNKYNGSKSSTYKEDGTKFELEHRDVKIEGFMSSDDLTISNKLIKQQSFGEATKISGFKMAISKYDGVFGLGLKSTDNKHKSLIDNLVEQKIVPDRIISFYFNRKNVSSSMMHHLNHTDQADGEVFLGGINLNRMSGNITYTNIVEKNRWVIKVDRIFLKGKGDETTTTTATTFVGNNKSFKRAEGEEEAKVCKNGCHAIVWTGAPLMVGPKKLVAQINKKLGAKELASGAWQLNDCSDISKLPDLVITINGRDLHLKPEQYIIKTKALSEEICFSGLAGADQYKPGWILGDVFMSAYYTIFDYENKRVGFAHSRA